MYPALAAGEQRPFSSNLNLGENQDVPNMAVVKLSADYSIEVYNHQGKVHYLFDVSAVVLDEATTIAGDTSAC